MADGPLLVFTTGTDGHEIGRLPHPPVVPRVGEQVLLESRTYSVISVTYDVPAGYVRQVTVACQPTGGGSRIIA